MSKIVVGHDGSHHGHAALREALQLAGALGLPVVVIRAFALDDSGYAGGTLRTESLADIEAGESALLADDIAALTKSYPEVRVEARAKQGNAAPVLLHESKGARMLVVGSRGLGGISRLIGSVSDRIVAHATTTVVVVRHDDVSD